MGEEKGEPGGGRASDEHASDPVSPAGSGEEDVGAIELSLAILPLGPLGEAQGPGGARLVGHRHVGGLGGQEGQFGGDAARAGRAAEEAAELAERQAVHGGAGPGRAGGEPGVGRAIRAVALPPPDVDGRRQAAGGVGKASGDSVASEPLPPQLLVSFSSISGGEQLFLTTDTF